MTREGWQVFQTYDCKCGMGKKCLIVQRKLEKAKLLDKDYYRTPCSKLSELNRRKEEDSSMSKWNNISDLTHHREVIKVSSPGLDTSFSVVTYNILADCHMEPAWYQYTPDTCRTSLQRHESIMAELDVLQADILCLQEVGLDYQPYLTTELGHRGYVGDYYPKTMGTMEGVATFFKKSQFEVVDVVKISFNEMLKDECDKRGIDYISLDCERPHVFLITKLRHNNSGRILTIGNIHTVWDSFSQLDVTTLQVSLALARLTEEAEDRTMIMAGDFNSRQNMAPYYLLHNGHLSSQLQKELVGVASASHRGQSLYQLLSDCYEHDQADLTSSYLTVKGSEPELTNYDDYDGQHPADWTLDYIWYTADTLRADAVLDTMGVPHSRIPNELYPSDHLSLKTTFTFI